MRNKAFKKFLDNIFFSFQRLACLKNFLEKYKEVKKITHNCTAQIEPLLTFCCVFQGFFMHLYMLYIFKQK